MRKKDLLTTTIDPVFDEHTTVDGVIEILKKSLSDLLALLPPENHLSFLLDLQAIKAQEDIEQFFFNLTVCLNEMQSLAINPEAMTILIIAEIALKKALELLSADLLNRIIIETDITY